MSRDIARRVRDALDATARTAVHDERRPPPFDPWSEPSRHKHRRGWTTPVLAAAAVAVVAVGGVVAVRTIGSHGARSVAGHGSLARTLPAGRHSTAPGGSGAPGQSKPVSPTHPVHVSLFQGDGQTYGIGMPIIAQFSRPVTDAHAFDKAVTVTIDGQPAGGAWFWENSDAGYAMEAHYRPPKYWPAHATIEMNMPLKDVSAGPGLSFDDSLTLKINTGAAHISTVDGSTERMTVTSDGKPIKVLPVSLGQASTPTYLGTKIVMAKTNPQHMVSAPGEANPYSLEVPWSVRLTNSGEFVHAASWNGGNIGSRSTSHGCTNLNTGDAQWYYQFSLIGDVVQYSNTGTSQVMPSWDGFGDWNLSWSQWQAGGLLKN